MVNPARRALDQQRRSLQSQLTQRQARYAALTLHPESDPAELPEWERRKAALVEEVLGVGGTALTDLRRELLGRNQLAVTAFRSVTIDAEDVQQLEHTLEEVKQKQQKTPSHLAWEELTKEAQCERLAPVANACWTR